MIKSKEDSPITLGIKKKILIILSNYLKAINEY
jgi:hypothetical protein